MCGGQAQSVVYGAFYCDESHLHRRIVSSVCNGFSVLHGFRDVVHLVQRESGSSGRLVLEARG